METEGYISSAQAAKALAVSVSTVKRWVDDGVLPAHRTAGGHRKLLRSEVLALARSGDLPRSEPAASTLAPGRKQAIDLKSAAAQFGDALLRGEAGEVRGLIRHAYQSGVAVETLADHLIAPVMQRVGHDWETQRIDVWQEHRCTRICAGALQELHGELEKRAEKNRPVALGAAPEGDFSELATHLAQLVLLDAGWQAINLGPNTPFASLARAMRELKPRLIWLSVSHEVDQNRFLQEYTRFQKEADRAGVALAVGGRALVQPLRSQMLYTTHGDGLSHLAAFARTLHPRPRRPRRGRPPAA